MVAFLHEGTKVVVDVEQLDPLTCPNPFCLGFTILDNVYSLNGTLYVVRSDTKPGSFPEVRTMISNAGNPSLSIDDNMRIISEHQAIALFGSQASRVEGTTVSIETPAQHM